MSNTSGPTVAIVGAGYAGMTAARRLAGRADVVLIHPTEEFIDRIRLHEYVAGTCLRADVALPITRYLPLHAGLLVDHAVAVSPNGVTLASGGQVEADHVSCRSAAVHGAGSARSTVEPACTADSASYRAHVSSSAAQDTPAPRWRPRSPQPDPT